MVVEQANSRSERTTMKHRPNLEARTLQNIRRMVRNGEQLSPEVAYRAAEDAAFDIGFVVEPADRSDDARLAANAEWAAALIDTADFCFAEVARVGVG
jgi:hypothetical protein